MLTLWECSLGNILHGIFPSMLHLSSRQSASMERPCLLFRSLLVCLTIHAFANPLAAPIRAGHYLGTSPFLAHPMNDDVFGAQCFEKANPYAVEFKPISYRDCIEAAKKAMLGGKAGAPMHFSRDAEAGMGMPETWSHGRCAIRIDVKEHDDEDTFPMVAVANAASLLAQRCSKPSTPGLGGMGLIGPKKVIMIFVYGHDPDPPPKPRPSVPPMVKIA